MIQNYLNAMMWLWLNKKTKMALYHSPDYQISFESMGLSVQAKFSIDFQDGFHVAIFDKSKLFLLFWIYTLSRESTGLSVNWGFG